MIFFGRKFIASETTTFFFLLIFIDGLRKAGDAPGHKIVVAFCVCVFVVVVVVVVGGSC